MAVYGNGLTSVAFGTIANDGGPATTFTELGSTLAGSMKLASADGTTNEFFIEEQSDPILKKTQAGSMTLTWNCADISAQTMQKLFGGTVTGTGANGDEYVYAAPVGGVVAQEKSLKIINGDGVTMTICRASVFAKFDMAFAKDQVSLISVTATILTPTKTNEPAYTFKYPSAV